MFAGDERWPAEDGTLALVGISAAVRSPSNLPRLLRRPYRRADRVAERWRVHVREYPSCTAAISSHRVISAAPRCGPGAFRRIEHFTGLPSEF